MQAGPPAARSAPKPRAMTTGLPSRVRLRSRLSRDLLQVEGVGYGARRLHAGSAAMPWPGKAGRTPMPRRAASVLLLLGPPTARAAREAVGAGRRIAGTQGTFRRWPRGAAGAASPPGRHGRPRLASGPDARTIGYATVVTPSVCSRICFVIAFSAAVRPPAHLVRKRNDGLARSLDQGATSRWAPDARGGARR